MQAYNSKKIRNIALIGHGGCGKTTLLEEILFSQKITSRVGSVTDGNTVSDYDKMEIERGNSINMSMIPVEYKGVKINFIDTPGLLDFSMEMYSALQACEAALIVVDAGAGVQVGTEKAWQACKEMNKPALIMIRCKDKDEYDFDQLVDDISAKFGGACVPAAYPLTDDMTEAFNELIAETDEELMNKYFEEGEFTDAEFLQGLRAGIAAADIVPVFAYKDPENLLDIIKAFAPLPMSHAPYTYKVDGEGEEKQLAPAVDGDVVAFVFKTLADPFVGKISMMKVITGELKAGTELYNTRALKAEKINKMSFMRGKEQIETKSAAAGDIVAVTKLGFTTTGDTLSEKDKSIVINKLNFAPPTLFVAVSPAKKGEEDKMATSLNKLKEEDPSFEVTIDKETKQTLLGTQGEMQQGVVIAKLKDRFNVEIVTKPRRIAYRETIKGNSDVQGKHKKQSGGAGQYGDVHIRFSPSPDKILDFSEELFGGSIPKNYVPAVEKGIIECMEKGPIAGYPVVNIKAVLYDGSYHDVDSNEMAFKTAASLAFKKGIAEAKPVLLEPIMKVDIVIPDNFMGDVMGDMNKRRAKILGMEPMSGGQQKLMAEAPMAELLDYTIALKAMTQARGSFTMEFLRYEEVPQHLAQKIIAESQQEEA